LSGARGWEALGNRDKDSSRLTQAWAINQMILAATNSAATNRDAVFSPETVRALCATKFFDSRAGGAVP
jgi:hypothetical protein